MNRRGFLAAIGLAPVAAVSTLVKADAAEPVAIVDPVPLCEALEPGERIEFEKAYLRHLERKIASCHRRIIDMPTMRVHGLRRA